MEYGYGYYPYGFARHGKHQKSSSQCADSECFARRVPLSISLPSIQSAAFAGESQSRISSFSTPDFAQMSSQATCAAASGLNLQVHGVPPARQEIQQPVPRHEVQLRQIDVTSSGLELIDGPTPRQAVFSNLQFLSGPSDRMDGFRSIDTVVHSSSMPIGSQTQSMRSPSWGVVKISNIPYSITKPEISQFLGRNAKLISADKGCAIHIIMERSTAKTMDCYAEFLTARDAADTVKRINSSFESGRNPRLGNRHVDVELSSQDALLKDLFPRAKSLVWHGGAPTVVPNTDPYSTGFRGFFTSEEIMGAIRHAEFPQRSPYASKCPQRTYESTISTLYKFPWYATDLYTVHDRNTLFELASRHLQSLSARVRRSNTVGLDARLLRSLLYAGLDCPVFNARQKYTLCVRSQDVLEIMKCPEISKWFPFDSLVQVSGFDAKTLLYYADLIKKGSAVQGCDTGRLPNNYPADNPELDSPYGQFWLEWPSDVSQTMLWEDAVQHEMAILRKVVMAGWAAKNSAAAPTAAVAEASNLNNARMLSGFAIKTGFPSPCPSEHSSSWPSTSGSRISVSEAEQRGVAEDGFPEHTASRRSTASGCADDDASDRLYHGSSARTPLVQPGGGARNRHGAVHCNLMA